MDLKSESKPKLYPMYIQYETRRYISKYVLHAGFPAGSMRIFFEKLEEMNEKSGRLGFRNFCESRKVIGHG